MSNIDTSTNYKLSADQEQKIKARKRIFELSLKSLGEIPQLQDLNEEQNTWLRRKGVRL